MHYWSLEKLRQRLELMREMYRNEAEQASPLQSPDFPGHADHGPENRPIHPRFLPSFTVVIVSFTF